MIVFESLYEYYDSAFARDNIKISPEELRDMTNIRYLHNEFNSGFYQGNKGGELHDAIYQSVHGANELNTLGHIDQIYQIFIKKIPELKYFKVNQYSSEPFYLHFQKPIYDDVKIGTLDIWIKQHLKNEKILNHKKWKFSILMSCSMNDQNTDDEFIYVDAYFRINKKNVSYETLIKLIPQIRHTLHKYVSYIRKKYDVNILF